MKTPRLSLVVLVAMLFGGCYTQLAVTRDEPESVVDAQQAEIIQPLPTVIVVVPILNSVPPPYYPFPVVGIPAPGSVTQGQAESPKRDFGNTRTGSGSDANTRPIVRERGGR